ncbi:MAG TPA: cytochrome c oxidase assembly protein [Acidimicrobiales bacterium]|jgi:cytochrome c oxidase assembly factor CtaG
MMLAHHAVAPSQLWTAWRPDPLVVVALVLAAVGYRRGVVALRARARPGPRRGEVAAFTAGLVAVAVALASPLEGAAGALFSAHMLQHLLLVLVAAPLLAAGRPALAIGAAFPATTRRAWRRQAARPAARRATDVVLHPVVVWALGTVTLWAWHLPVLYDAAVRHDLLHAVEHASLLGTALLLWTVVWGRGPRPAATPTAVGLLFATALASAALGAVLTLAGTPLYDVHATTTAAWGLSPLEDQQLAGATMWVPAGLVYMAVMAGLLGSWLSSLDREPATP